MPLPLPPPPPPPRSAAVASQNCRNSVKLEAMLQLAVTMTASISLCRRLTMTRRPRLRRLARLLPLPLPPLPSPCSPSVLVDARANRHSLLWIPPQHPHRPLPPLHLHAQPPPLRLRQRRLQLLRQSRVQHRRFWHALQRTRLQPMKTHYRWRNLTRALLRLQSCQPCGCQCSSSGLTQSSGRRHLRTLSPCFHPHQ